MLKKDLLQVRENDNFCFLSVGAEDLNLYKHYLMKGFERILSDINAD